MNFTATTPSANVSQLASTAPPPPGMNTNEPQWAIIVRWIIGCVIILVGTVGNVMVCVVVYKNQRMQTAMNLFLVNLAAWDVLVCLFNLPFTLIYVQMKSWPFGLFWCKAMPTLQVMNLSASTGSLLAITVERFRAICRPFTPPLSRFQAKLTIVVVSLASFLLALPEVGAYELGGPFGCEEVFPTIDLRKAYSLLLFLACYLIPLIIIVPAYTIMIYKLWRTDNEDNTPSSGVSEDPKNRKRKRNVLKMMVVVVICYAICMMPSYALYIWLDFGLKGDPPSYFSTLLSYVQLVTFFNSCINPIIYWFLSEQFTKGFKKILRCNKFNSWTRQHSSTTSSEPNLPNVNTVPTRV